MMRKLVSCLFACALIASVYGCGGKSGDTASNPELKSTGVGMGDKAAVEKAKEAQGEGKKLTGKNKMLLDEKAK